MRHIGQCRTGAAKSAAPLLLCKQADQHRNMRTRARSLALMNTGYGQNERNGVCESV